MQTLLLIIGTLILPAYGLPVITDPCGGGGPAGKTAYLTTDQLVAEGTVHDAALEASIFAKILKRKYNNPKDPHIRISDTMKTLLTGTELNNFPIVSQPHGDDSLSTKVQHHYDNVSIIAVFADVVYNDELKSTRINHFKPEMLDFNTAVAQLLCKIHLYATSKGLEISKTIGHDAMSSMYRNMKNAPARDFVIFRDARKYLKGVSEEYAS